MPLPSDINPQETKVIVGMSGGVDSSVSAYLLQQQGFQVEGVFMKNWEEDDNDEYCAAAQDLADAQAVADKLGITLHSINFAAEYWDNVFEYFLAEYKAGRTPNPDIMCNKEIKFKAFLEYAAEDLGADYIATGHYVSRDFVDGQWRMLRGHDQNKDQSYFLHAVSGQQFVKTLFPLGELTKTQVRHLAEKAGLHNHQKKDSTGICFIGERRFKDFLENYIPAQPGPILDEHGKTIGQHQGLMYHTIGQRQGLGIGGLDGAADAPWYVAEKKMHSNTLIAVQGNQHPALLKSVLQTEAPHWINSAPTLPLACSAKTRYRQPDQACSVATNPSGGLTVEFAAPQRAITPGQYVVFYDGQHCLGGAVIQ